ncbi:hypothetical protein [Yersinia phage fPS-19]|uniref:Uncharacterized protein n=11 Tax=Helsettvirus fPS9 TaxID=2733625 RepID=A0A2D0PE08_9CAUD|nr:hypothetical protein HOS88_gp22 [Yersinia phage fPS-9]SOO46355.1 hypothetical protein [Yersinia phage fPS-52]SOO46404.1 hypothetical protein [Yersinia phage fPS-19]SOO46455.1 hypothetical protein [Yersinia phage fPS-26]SOO46506.1 hypothetical protein [Yersinia phage fPS-7]SOO46658.1 hypothetical protein [Yersinia phage fPS-86]SOO46710.1 hypothetical protein [Yersinia phage fPS-50]SOO46759.1 hypothetical protein [Yersinia phage fPS-21]SOO46857.1 hypothetical protein [Yersinia phage fPS-64
MSKIIADELRELLTKMPWSDELPESYELWQVGDWTDEGKTEGKVDVVKHLPSGRFYEVFFTRQGQPSTGYYTSFEGICEVEPYEAKVILWKEVAQ